jgi:hypothetical protein
MTTCCRTPVSSLDFVIMSHEAAAWISSASMVVDKTHWRVARILRKGHGARVHQSYAVS